MDCNAYEHVINLRIPNVKSNVSFTVKNVLILCYLLFKTSTRVQRAVKGFPEVATETQITSLGTYKCET